MYLQTKQIVSLRRYTRRSVLAAESGPPRPSDKLGHLETKPTPTSCCTTMQRHGLVSIQLPILCPILAGTCTSFAQSLELDLSEQTSLGGDVFVLLGGVTHSNCLQTRPTKTYQTQRPCLVSKIMQFSWNERRRKNTSLDNDRCCVLEVATRTRACATCRLVRASTRKGHCAAR